MNTVVLDTNILIDNVHGFAPWLSDCLAKPESFQFVIPSIVFAEYFAAQELEIKVEVDKSRAYLALFTMQDLTIDIAETLGTLLRRKTHPPSAGLGDLIIASTAITLNAPLATRNKNHFANIPNLRFFDPTTIRN